MARSYPARYTSRRPIFRKGQMPRARRKYIFTKTATVAAGASNTWVQVV